MNLPNWGIRRRSTRRGFTQLDLYVSILLAVLFLAFLMWGSGKAHRTGYLVGCMANLKQMGQAMLEYANSNDGHYPRTHYDPGDPTMRAYTGVSAHDPFAPNGPQANDVTAALYLLLRTTEVKPDIFVCPGVRRSPWNFGGNGLTALDHSNFPSDLLLSYSIQNPYPSAQVLAAGFRWTNTLKADYAIAADMNPGTPELLTLTPFSSPMAMYFGNSRNHPRIGSTVLYGDGHVELQQTPFSGVNQDNIYAYGPPLKGSLTPSNYPSSSGISGPPVHPHDNVLLPVATSDPHPTAFYYFIDSGLAGWWLKEGMLTAALVWVGVRIVWPLLVRAYRLLMLSFEKAKAQTPAARRLRNGLCPACGYDLRASPLQCPECGRVRD